MAKYTVDLKGIGSIQVSKRRGMKTMRLRITPTGEIAVSAPWYVPKTTIIGFVVSRKEWIDQHTHHRQEKFFDGMRFGRNLQLFIHEDSGTRFRSKIDSNCLNVYLPVGFDLSDKADLEKIRNAIHRCLQRESEETLLPRLLELSTYSKMPFNQAYIKRLTGRWGSCDTNRNIILNCFLVQLPENLVDYVIYHELAHTMHLNHSQDFWAEVESHCPDYKKLRKTLKKYEPRIIARDQL